MYTAIFTTLVVAASLGNAVRVTSPTDDSLWQSGSSQTISWESVSTDPQQFDIQLVNQAGFLTNSPVTLKEDQSTSSQSTTISYPSGNWPEGTAFQINLVAKPNAGNSGFAILAQSGQFNITSGGSNSRSSAAASSSTTTGTAPTTVRQSTTTSTIPATSSGAAVNGNSGDASGGIPNSQTQPTGAALANFDAPTGLISLLAVAAGIIGVTI